MTAQQFYEYKRRRGCTDNITQNDNPDYSLPFYQEIFSLMESYIDYMTPIQADELIDESYNEDQNVHS